jgi:hypothetical protein
MSNQEKVMHFEVVRMKKRKLMSAARRTWKQSAVVFACLSSLLTPVHPSAYSADNATNISSENSPANGQKQELTLNDVQDAGILLRYIRRQSINIYEEASRTRLTLKSSPKIPQINEIPTRIHYANELPPRRQWIIFFLTSMEPVIRELGVEISNTQEGLKPVISDDLKKSVDPLWQEWSENVKTLNSHLDELMPLLEDAPHNNQKIRDVAVKIFDDANKLESVRRRVFIVLSRAERLKPGKGILVNPVD